MLIDKYIIMFKYLLLEASLSTSLFPRLSSIKTSPSGSTLLGLAFLFVKITFSRVRLLLDFSLANDRFKASITDLDRWS